MKQKSIAIATVLVATMLTAIFTTAPQSAEGQLQSCPVGYHRDILGTCVPNAIPLPDTLPTSENRTEQNIVCSGFSYTCG